VCRNPAAPKLNMIKLLITKTIAKNALLSPKNWINEKNVFLCIEVITFPNNTVGKFKNIRDLPIIGRSLIYVLA
jgi:hypothetical protein